jgi:hypothetical protein
MIPLGNQPEAGDPQRISQLVDRFRRLDLCFSEAKLHSLAYMRRNLLPLPDAVVLLLGFHLLPTTEPFSRPAQKWPPDLRTLAPSLPPI